MIAIGQLLALSRTFSQNHNSTGIQVTRASSIGKVVISCHNDEGIINPFIDVFRQFL